MIEKAAPEEVEFRGVVVEVGERLVVLETEWGRAWVKVTDNTIFEQLESLDELGEGDLVGVVGFEDGDHVVATLLVLIEKAELTHGSTWHAAGLLPLFNMSYSVGQLHRYSVELYKKLHPGAPDPF